MLTAIHRYPVKSMLGESLQSAPLDDGGIVGDRCWAVRDEVRGGIRGAKVLHELMNFAARYPDNAHAANPCVNHVDITLPDGQQIQSDANEVNAVLSQALANEVTLWPLQPPENAEHYRRGAPVLDDMEAEFRRMFARTDDEPLPDLAAFPPELAEYESPVGTYFDAYPLLIATTGSLDLLTSAHPDGVIDLRRFRPNLVIDAPPVDGKPAELAWAGKTLRIGSAEIAVEIPCPRCIMTTLPFAELPKDPKIMRTLVREFDGDFGIYAKVSKPGTVSINDAINVID